MKKFVAAAPDLGSKAVAAFRTGDDDQTLAALAAGGPPFDAEVSAELVAIAYAARSSMAHPRGGDLRKRAKQLVDKHVAGARAFAAAFKGIGNRTHELDHRIRELDHPLRLAVAKAIAFHTWQALSVPFAEDAEFRGEILDLVIANAKRDKKTELSFGEIYTEWHGSHGAATSTNLHVVPGALAKELTARRSAYKFTGLSFWGCSLTDLPASLAKAKAWLTELQLGFNPLAKVPKVVFELTNLEELSLLGTELEDIPDGILKLKKLRRLDLGNGKNMQSIPESVCAHDQIRELRIGNGSIKLVPAAIAGMKSLEVLELQSAGKITKLPDEIATLPNLRLVKAKWSRLNPAKTRALLPKRVKLEL